MGCVYLTVPGLKQSVTQLISCEFDGADTSILIRGVHINVLTRLEISLKYGKGQYNEQDEKWNPNVSKTFKGVYF